MFDLRSAGDRRRWRDVADGEFELGWPALLTCFVIAVFSWGFAAYGPAVYLPELSRRFGWSTAMIGSATTVSFMIGAALLPWVGSAIERAGPRAVLTGGVLSIDAAAIGISEASSLWQVYACNLIMGVGWACASGTAISITLARYFDRHRGFALSVALTGASAGGFAVAPALVSLSYHSGFHVAVPEVALALLLVILPLIRMGISGPSVTGRATSGPGGESAATTRRDALRGGRFWSIAVPFALAISAQVGMMVYQVSYLLPLLGAAGTSLALIGTNVAAGGGRLLLSPIIDHLDQRRVAAITFASQACAVTLMVSMPGSPAALYVGSTIFGFCMGNVVALPTLIIQREFPPRTFGMMLGLSTAIGQFAYSISPVLLGLVHDVSKGYRSTLVVCVALQAAAALLVLRRRGVRGMPGG
jgi:MFS family permease